jgi:hypothetical protein
MNEQTYAQSLQKASSIDSSFTQYEMTENLSDPFCILPGPHLVNFLYFQ